MFAGGGHVEGMNPNDSGSKLLILCRWVNDVKSLRKACEELSNNIMERMIQQIDTLLIIVDVLGFAKKWS